MRDTCPRVNVTDELQYSTFTVMQYTLCQFVVERSIYFGIKGYGARLEVYL